MGSIIRRSCALAVVAACVAAGETPEPAPGPPATREVPQLRPGEILIRKTGRKRVTRTPSLSAPQQRKADPVVELPYEGVGPRRVTIGYFRRDPIETGWGPQVHWPVYYGGGYCSSPYVGGYSYGSRHTPSYCDSPLLIFGSHPYSIPRLDGLCAPMSR